MLSESSMFILIMIISAAAFRFIRMAASYYGMGPRIVHVRTLIIVAVTCMIGFMIYGLSVHMIMDIKDGYSPVETVITIFLIYMCTNFIIGISRDAIIRWRYSRKEPDDGTYCEECGYLIEGDYGFCTRCGAEFKLDLMESMKKF